MVKTETLCVSTKGNCDIVNLTDKIADFISKSEISDGTVTVFHVGSTGAITTTEYEPGLVNHDIARTFEKIAPQNDVYEHEKTWHDDRG